MTYDEKKGMYFPSEEIVNQANVKEYEQLYKYSIENREKPRMISPMTKKSD